MAKVEIKILFSNSVKDGLADRLRGGVYPLTVGSNSKPGAGSVAEESNAGLWSQGAAHSGGPRAGETGGG